MLALRSLCGIESWSFYIHVVMGHMTDSGLQCVVTSALSSLKLLKIISLGSMPTLSVLSAQALPAWNLGSAFFHLVTHSQAILEE